MFWDKVNHFLAFTLGGWLAAGALRTSVPTAANTRVVILAVILVAVFGFADEMLQTITPDRSGANIYDWAADVLGALTGALLSLTTHRLSFRFSKERQ